MKCPSFQFIVLLIFGFASFNLQAASVYQAQNPKDDLKAQKICEENKGEYFGSQALVKVEDGALHPDGPNATQVADNFAQLTQSLRESNSNVAEKYHSAENWEWLEIRFVCYESERDLLSFILRARSTGGIFRSYELTYIYAGNQVVRNQNRLDISNTELESPISDGFAVNGGLTDESPLDSAFVTSVLDVALGEDFIINNPLN